MRGIVVILCALLAAGCSEILQRGTASVDEMLGQVVSVARAPAAEQKSALARAQALFDRDRSPINQLRLAALLATLAPPLRDDARAADLLEPLSEASSPGIGRFAAFLAAQVSERQRILREMERAVARERERADRDRAAADKDRAERDKREEALRQQLDALRAIERGILEREDRLRRRQR